MLYGRFFYASEMEKIWLYPVSFDCAALCDYHFYQWSVRSHSSQTEGNGSIGTKRRKRPDDNHVAGCVWNGRLGKRDFNGYGYRDDQGAGGHCKDWHLQKDDRARGRKRTRLY